MAESLKVNVAVRVPPTVGLKVIFAVQLDPAARLDPHVLLKILKSPGSAPASATLLMVIAEEPLFVRVATFCPPIPPTVTEAQLSDDGLTDALPPDVLPPVPDRDTLCGLLLALSEIVSVPVRVPVLLGLNATETVQLAEADRLVPHVLLEMMKSPGFEPVRDMPLIVIIALVPLCTVVVCALPVEPTFTVPNDMEVGVMLTIPLELVPKPERATVCGLGLAESLKFKLAVRVPVVVGLKVMLAVQLADAARVDPHVLLKILKSPAFEPDSVMLLMVMALLPLFVSVAIFCPPIPPTGTDAQLRLLGETEAAMAAAGAKKESAANALHTGENRGLFLSPYFR